MISVLMSIYNEKIEWIKESVYSIVDQTYNSIEFIIVIDNPDISDEIKKFLFEIQNTDSRIRLVWNEENIGLARSLNKAVLLAEGEYIARMDADDISELCRLEKELKYLKENGLQMVSANKVNIDEEGKLIDKDPPERRDPNKVLVYSNIIVHPLVLAEAEIIRKLGGYRAFLNAEDLDLWLRMTEAGYKIGIMEEYLLKYRIRSNSASVGRQLEQYYINRYIVSLAKERKKKNTDSFSEENQRVYISKKNITEKKKIRFSKANADIKTALDYAGKKDIRLYIYIVKAFFNSPAFTLEKIIGYVRSHL